MTAAVLAVRVLIVAAAFTGFGHAVLPGGVRWLDLAYWSQISSLLVGAVAVAGIVVTIVERDGRAMPAWLAQLRGATTGWALVTLVIFWLLLGGDYSSPASALEHLVTPLLAAAEWIWLGARRRLAWFSPLLWVGVPLLYLPVYLAGSAVSGPLYPFFRPGEDGFGTWFVILLLVFAAMGQVVWLRSLVRSPHHVRSPHDDRPHATIGPDRS